MWFVYILLLLAIAYLGMRLYRIETEHPFQNPKGASSSIPRLSATPSKPLVRSEGDGKRFCGYEKLLTNGEGSFFGVLLKGLNEEYYVFSKVRMADVLEPVAQTPAARQSALNQICSKHLDFVVCRKGSWEIVAGIELDDSSHEEAGRAERDQFLNEAFQQAGIPLMRVPAQASYSVEEIAGQFQKAVTERRTVNPAPAPSATAVKPATPSSGRKPIPQPHQVLVAA